MYSIFYRFLLLLIYPPFHSMIAFHSSDYNIEIQCSRHKKYFFERNICYQERYPHIYPLFAHYYISCISISVGFSFSPIIILEYRQRRAQQSSQVNSILTFDRSTLFTLSISLIRDNILFVDVISFVEGKFSMSSLTDDFLLSIYDLVVLYEIKWYLLIESIIGKAIQRNISLQTCIPSKLTLGVLISQSMFVYTSKPCLPQIRYSIV